MKKRHLYVLLFGVPGCFVSAAVTLFAAGALLGVFWLFIFGDDPWPAAVEPLTSILIVLVFLLAWIGSMLLGYTVGRRLENEPALNPHHILLSAGLTVFFLLFIILQQWRVGNLGPKSDNMLCSEYCSAQGYSASGMPPQNSGDRTCSCYDASGNEALKTPLDMIEAEPLK